METEGGLLAALRKGIVAQWINESVRKRQKATATRKEAIVGVNEYPNLEEKLPSQPTRREEGVQESEASSFHELRSEQAKALRHASGSA